MPDINRPYTCQVNLALPSPIHAQHLKDVVSVDGELGNKIIKSFSIVGVSPEEHGAPNTGMEVELRVLRIDFAATDAKMLRVAISTTYDMIIVALKCFQEFSREES